MAVLTLVLGGLLTNMATKRQRDSDDEQDDKTRDHAEALAEKRNAAELQAQVEAREAADHSAREEARLDACVRALNAIAVLRSALAASARINADLDLVTKTKQYVKTVKYLGCFINP